MACKYTITGSTSREDIDLSIDQLRERLKSEADKALDIVFKLDSAVSKQDFVYDLISQARKSAAESKFGEGEPIYEKKASLLIDGDPDISHDQDVYTPNTLIDSDAFLIDGKRPFFRIDTSEYVSAVKDQMVNRLGYSEETAKAWGDRVQLKWDHIADVAREFHEILMSNSERMNDDGTKTGTSWVDVTDKSDYFKSMGMDMQEVENAVMFEVFKRNGKDKRGIDSDAKLMKNVWLEADLHDMASKILGHIDYLVVRNTGEIEIFQVKTSTEPFETWAGAKMEKYRYQMALLKQMLAFHGVDPRTVHLNIIPVQMNFDNEYEGVESMNVHPAISMDVHDMIYMFRKYDAVAEQFIDSKVTFGRVDTSALQEATSDLQHFFPGKDVYARGIQMTAKEWVRKNWRACHPKPNPGLAGWTLKIPGEAKEIQLSDPRKGDKNEEFVKIIEERLDDESSSLGKGDLSAHRMKEEVQNAYRSGVYRPSGSLGHYVSEQFAKYLVYTEDPDTGKRTYDWRIINSDTLDAANVIIFQNQHTGQLDVFVVSSMNPDTKYSFKGRENLLGYYLPDLNSENFNLECNYGNIDVFRGITLLNRILPGIDGKIQLGKLQVINLNEYSKRKGVYYEFSQILPEWGKAVGIINRNTDANIDNNFANMNIECVRPEDVLAQTFAEIVSDPHTVARAELIGVADIINGKTKVDGSTIDGLVSVRTVEAKLDKLEQLYDRLHKIAEEKSIPLSDMNGLLKLSRNSYDKERAPIARMLVCTMQAISYYSGDISMTNEDFSQLQEYALKMSSMKNSSARRVGYLTQKAIDNVRDTIVNEFSMRVRPIFDKYYKACGYTVGKNAIVGNQVALFDHLYELDDEGNRTLSFKNPYDGSSDLSSHERTFLKEILYEFYRVRCGIFNAVPEISGIDDPKLIDKMPEGYLNLPLQKASSATNSWLRDPVRAAKAFGDKAHRLMTHPGDYLDEVAQAMAGEDTKTRDSQADLLRIYNPYTRTLIKERDRDLYIDERGLEYFETNVENVFADFMSKAVQCKEFERLLVRIKGIELALELRGINEEGETNNSEEIKHAIKAIEDFTTVNVFNKSLMEKQSRTIDAILSPFRRLVSQIYIAINPVAATRDTLQGLEENFLMSAIKFQTDVSPADVAFGYAEVLKEGPTNIMKMSKLNQFNVKYAFSNFDAAQVASMLKTGRTGVLNFDNWAYCTLRGPDYLNRMTLFVARMHHDGVYDAYSLDAEGRLKYDWHKDKRFSALAAGDTSNPKYNEQQSLYMSLIRAFNLENPSAHLSYTDDLPDAYTMEEIRAIKALGESIYGAYDKASKSKYEHVAIGRNFLMFTTWMNGLIDTYFKSRQISSTEVELQQETDYNGNKLYFTADRTGNITTENTGIPVMKHVPIMVQGVFATLHQAFDELRANNWSFSEMSHNVFSNSINRRNLRRLITDMLVMAILGTIFGMAVKPAYKKHKAEDDGSTFVKNVMVEMLYKGALSSYDTFMGPAAVVAYLGDSVSPAAYTLQTKLVKDVYKTITGDKSFGTLVMGLQAFLRTAQDSYRMYMRELREENESINNKNKNE